MYAKCDRPLSRKTATFPAFHRAGPRFYLLDFLLPAGMGGIWVGAFVRQLKSRPLLPLHDPRFEGVLEHGN